MSSGAPDLAINSDLAGNLRCSGGIHDAGVSRRCRKSLAWGRMVAREASLMIEITVRDIWHGETGDIMQMTRLMALDER
jgi:hypothetical protein